MNDAQTGAGMNAMQPEQAFVSTVLTWKRCTSANVPIDVARASDISCPQRFVYAYSMEMTVVDAPRSIAGRVAALWSLRGNPQGEYSGLPKPFVELVVSLQGHHFWHTGEQGSSLEFEYGWLMPIQNGPRFATTIGSLHLIGARMPVDTACALFGPGIHDHGSLPVPLDCLIGHEAALLREQLIEQQYTLAQLRVLASWLSGRLSDPVSRVLPAAIAPIGWRADRLAGAMGLSMRGLRRHFRQRFGIGPKFWLQLNRFDRVLSANMRRDSLAALAADFGFSDQSHLTTEFRRFAGRPPSEYLKTRASHAAPDAAPHFVPDED
ncbi:MAG: helix-turn-helix domain-containing protein [Pseudomonadota bacterium]